MTIKRHRSPFLPSWCRRLWRFRSAGLGFSLGYGIVFAISAFLFLGFLWWHTIGYLERGVEQTVDADAQSLAGHWARGGLDELQQAIQERLDQDVEVGVMSFDVDDCYACVFICER